jgi:hypothetical protein
MLDISVTTITYSLSYIETGVISPYPTVVIVIQEKYNENKYLIYHYL